MHLGSLQEPRTSDRGGDTSCGPVCTRCASRTADGGASSDSGTSSEAHRTAPHRTARRAPSLSGCPRRATQLPQNTRAGPALAPGGGACELLLIRAASGRRRWGVGFQVTMCQRGTRGRRAGVRACVLLACPAPDATDLGGCPRCTPNDAHSHPRMPVPVSASRARVLGFDARRDPARSSRCLARRRAGRSPGWGDGGLCTTRTTHAARCRPAAHASRKQAYLLPLLLTSSLLPGCSLRFLGLLLLGNKIVAATAPLNSCTVWWGIP